jgi:hypothetical protein
MTFLTIEELMLELKDAGLPEQYAPEIIKLHGRKDRKIIDKDMAVKVIKNLLKAFLYTDKYEPKSLLTDTTFTPKELIMYVDSKFNKLIEKYKPFGLKLPFSCWEEARKWLIQESLEGVLETPRITQTTLGGEPLSSDVDILICSKIRMPFEEKISQQGRGGIYNLMCNSSPFLLETNYTIDLLNDYTGIDKIDLLKYFVCGTELSVPKAYLLKYSFLHQFFRIQINTIDMTRQEWLEIYELYRSVNNKKHTKQPSERMKRFARFLETKKVPTELQNATFYRELMRKWNDETGENIIEWRTIRQMHDRTIDSNEDISVLREVLLKMMD